MRAQRVGGGLCRRRLGRQPGAERLVDRAPQRRAVAGGGGGAARLRRRRRNTGLVGGAVVERVAVSAAAVEVRRTWRQRDVVELGRTDHRPLLFTDVEPPVSATSTARTTTTNNCVRGPRTDVQKRTLAVYVMDSE